MYQQPKPLLLGRQDPRESLRNLKRKCRRGRVFYSRLQRDAVQSRQEASMKLRVILGMLAILLTLAPASLRSQENRDVQVWLTSADKSSLFQQQKSLRVSGESEETRSQPVIRARDPAFALCLLQ